MQLTKKLPLPYPLKRLKIYIEDRFWLVYLSTKWVPAFEDQKSSILVGEVGDNVFLTHMCSVWLVLAGVNVNGLKWNLPMPSYPSLRQYISWQLNYYIIYIFEGKALIKQFVSLVSSITNQPLLVFCKTRDLARTIFKEWANLLSSVSQYWLYLTR